MLVTSYCLRRHHTFALPARACQLISVKSLGELKTASQQAQERQQPLLFLGEGSNTLFCEAFKGSVVIMRIRGIEVAAHPDNWQLHVGAGENWHQLVRYTLAHQMPGLENLALIPGTVGAAAIQNIGAYGVEFKNFCTYVDLWDLATDQVLRIPSAACGFTYRDSLFKQHSRRGVAIIAVGLTIAKRWQPALSYGELSQLDPTVAPTALFEFVCALRRRKLPDPHKIGNAGSFFKNPAISTQQLNALLVHHPELPFYKLSAQQVKVAAGWLIEKVGLKGCRIGDAAVHHHQALVLVNLGQATSLEVIKLASTVRRQVADCFDIVLTPEVCFMGATGPLDPATVLAYYGEVH